MKQIQNTTGAVEAILFVYGEPMEIKKIGKILGLDIETAKSILSDLAKDLENENRGIKLIFSGDEVELATKPQFSLILEQFIKDEFKEELTPASLETLSLITYFGPFSRNQVDYYRGVNSSFIIRSLLLRGLIERFPDPQKGNVYLYKPSFNLLKYLGISRIEELPDYGKYKEMMEKGINMLNESQTANSTLSK